MSTLPKAPAELTDADLAQALNRALNSQDARAIELIRHECDRRDRYTPIMPSPAASLLEAALWYASQGIAVFPLRPLGKRPATRHGFKEATIDPVQIRAWWKSTPQANVGIATGLLFDVADLDGWQGQDSWAALADPPKILGAVATPREEGGGRHLYVPLTGGGNRTNLAPGVDWRGDGGYVVAPPSRLPHGTYVWLYPIQVGEL